MFFFRALQDVQIRFQPLHSPDTSSSMPSHGSHEEFGEQLIFSVAEPLKVVGAGGTAGGQLWVCLCNRVVSLHKGP